MSSVCLRPSSVCCAGLERTAGFHAAAAAVIRRPRAENIPGGRRLTPMQVPRAHGNATVSAASSAQLEAPRVPEVRSPRGRESRCPLRFRVEGLREHRCRSQGLGVSAHFRRLRAHGGPGSGPSRRESVAHQWPWLVRGQLQAASVAFPASAQPVVPRCLAAGRSGWEGGSLHSAEHGGTVPSDARLRDGEPLPLSSGTVQTIVLVDRWRIIYWLGRLCMF